MASARSWYFDRFESRVPPQPVPWSAAREWAFQALAVAAIALGCWYLFWRWTESINNAPWWFASPLVTAETLAFVGSVLFFLSIWRTHDPVPPPPPRTVNDILGAPQEEDRRLIIDVFFPTYSEDPELVRLSLRDAKRLTYPHPVDLRIHVLDDGKRAAMKRVAEEEGAGYLTRPNNAGFKAGNLRNALEHTQGDLIVICDADTRPFPALLERTLGYFRDPRVAWVQTPQWFFDLDEGRPLPGPLQIFFGPWGADPLGNDPQLFYDVIQRRRNWCNAAFCCGAGSVHRREAVMEAALKAFGVQVQNLLKRSEAKAPDRLAVQDPELSAMLESAMAGEAARATELTPYKFHVSEDLYTSVVMHSDRERQWRSVYHPEILSKMLSPQDLLAWTIQRFKYAGGTLDIAAHDNPLFLPGLSVWQKLMYGATVWSYFAPLWTVPFLLAPVIYFFTGQTPVDTYDAAFYAHAMPFLLFNRVAFMLGTWGVPSTRGEQYYLAFFWVNLRAISDVLRGKPIKFQVTPKTREARRLVSLAWPHLTLMVLMAAGAIYRGLLVAHGVGRPSAYLANVFWSLNNVWSLSPLVFAALRRQEAE